MANVAHPVRRTTSEATSLAGELRGGPGYWLQSYALMLRWEVLNQRLMLPFMATIQILLGAGMALGFSLLIEDPSGSQALFLATGATVIPMMTLGLVMLPQEVAQQKIDGTYEYTFGLPIPRMAMYFAGLTVWSLVALPSAAIALVVAAWRYDLDLTVSPLVLVAAPLVVMVSSAAGYAFAHGLPNPRITHILTQLLIFIIIMFSPISFPAERLPGWLQAVHEVLPPQHAAVVMRGTLTEGLIDENLLPSFAILGAWAVGCWLITGWVLTRRR